MCSTTELILFSNNNYKLGERVRECCQKLNIHITYCNTLKLIVNKIESRKNTIIFIDKYYRKYAKFIKELVSSGFSFIESNRLVFIDEDMSFYADIVDNDKLFCIPETNLEVALYNTITTCEMLNYHSNISDASLRRVRENMSNMLIDLGFPYKLAGFRYIMHGMEQAIKNNFTLGSLNAEVYPYIAEQNSTTIVNIERGIRTSVQRASKKDAFQKEVLSGNNISVTNRFFMEYFLNKLILYKNSLAY